MEHVNPPARFARPDPDSVVRIIPFCFHWFSEQIIFSIRKNILFGKSMKKCSKFVDLTRWEEEKVITDRWSQRAAPRVRLIVSWGFFSFFGRALALLHDEQEEEEAAGAVTGDCGHREHQKLFLKPRKINTKKMMIPPKSFWIFVDFY